MLTQRLLRVDSNYHQEEEEKNIPPKTCRTGISPFSRILGTGKTSHYFPKNWTALSEIAQAVYLEY